MSLHVQGMSSLPAPFPPSVTPPPNVLRVPSLEPFVALWQRLPMAEKLDNKSPSRDTSRALFARAARVIPGGVNSPVRAFRAVGGHPVWFTHGSGPYVTDVDGNEYVDLVGQWGPALLGHAHPAVVHAVQDAAAQGLGFGAPHPNEVELAGLTASMLVEGTTTRSGADISRSAAEMGGSLGANAGDDNTTVGGEVLSEFAERYVALLADVSEPMTIMRSSLALNSRPPESLMVGWLNKDT